MAKQKFEQVARVVTIGNYTYSAAGSVIEIDTGEHDQVTNQYIRHLIKSGDLKPYKPKVGRPPKPGPVRGTRS